MTTSAKKTVKKTRRRTKKPTGKQNQSPVKGNKGQAKLKQQSRQKKAVRTSVVKKTSSSTAPPKRSTVKPSHLVVRNPFIYRLIQRSLWLLIFSLSVLIAGLFLPETFVIPVKEATEKDWHRNSFWFYPWGQSGVHRGIDIFAPIGQPVLAATSGLVVEAGERSMGGKVITILGPKWRLHYYAHLAKRQVRLGYWVTAGEIIGTVGNTGNAIGKAPHLHYSIKTLIPYFWQTDKTPYGNLKKWYINPTPYFHEALEKKSNDKN